MKPRTAGSGPSAAVSALAIVGVVMGLGLAPAPAAAEPQAFAVLVGLVFLLAGIAMLCFRRSRRLAAGCALATLLVFIPSFNWIAFGPGERQFTRSLGLGTSASTQVERGAVPEIEGRAVFGLLALGLDALLIAGLYRMFRAQKQSARKD
jgi:hypothetical protein